MNNVICRLVFNKSRGLWMAVYEHIRGEQSSKNDSAKSSTKDKKQTSDFIRACLIIILMGFGALGLIGAAFAELPVGTIPTGLNVVEGNITLHTPVINPEQINGQLLKIDQSSLKGILEGNNFNIGQDSAVKINHTYNGQGSATLIRINGPKTIIEGALSSPNGSIYLINQNGILFANGARVADVNGLVASALNLTNSDFLSNLGHLNAYFDGGRAAYVWGGDSAGFQEVLVQVEPDAHIKAALGSNVMLFAPKVINQGSIQSTEGQIVMAAGEKVYLSVAPDVNGGSAVGVYNYTKDSPYRGLAGVLVEVDSPDYNKKDLNGNDALDLNGKPVKLTGEVVNDTMGRILAQRGNVTMASFLVNQDGRVTATSSASQKGSIRLLARDTTDTASVGLASIEPSGNEPVVDFQTRLNQNITKNTIIAGSRTGKLNVGTNSITTVLAEDSAVLPKANEIFASQQVGEPVVKLGEVSYLESVMKSLNVKGSTLTDSQVFNAPTIEAVGRQVIIGDKAQIVAPGGFINISAQQLGQGFNVGNQNIPINTKDTESRLFIGNNTVIDAAGLKNVAVDMERNFVERLLTLTDLKNNPLNRDGFLYRKEVWFDIRDTPDSYVADLAGFVKEVPRSLGEKLATAGDIKLGSEGDLIQSGSSILDVSGGALKFNAGLNKESWVVAQNGKVYALGDAPADTLFTQFLGGTNTRNLFEAGYSEGKAAGTAMIDAYDMALDGQIYGGVNYGVYQRESKNMGGKLEINVMTPAGSIGHDVYVANTTPLNANFSATDALPESRTNRVEVDANMLSRSGFEDVSVNTTANVKVNASIRMMDGANLSLSGSDIEVNQNFVARGGSISLKSAVNDLSELLDETNVKVADGVILDVSGNWVNDRLSVANGRVIINGGKVLISSGDEVRLGSGSLVDVSGGGWLQGTNKLINGDAGSINIASQSEQGGQDNPYTYIAPNLKGELRGFALGTGGELSITSPFVTIGNTGFRDEREFLATPEFFQSSGFASFHLTGRDGLLVKSNTNVNVIAKNYVLDSGYQNEKTGGHVNDFASPTVLPDYLRTSTSLALSTLATDNALPADAFLASGVARGSIVVETKASLKVDANGLRTNSIGEKVSPTIALSAWDNQIVIDGTLQAPAGDISLTMNGDVTLESDPGYNAAQAIWLGVNAKLLAVGYTRNTPTGSILRAGDVYGGGNIALDAKKGYVVAKKGSMIDVSGSSAIFDVRNNQGFTPTNVSSNGGDVSINAREGILLDSSFKATSPGGLGGSLEVRLTRGSSHNIGFASSPYPGSAENSITGNPGNRPNQQWYVDLSQSGTFIPEYLAVGFSVESEAAGLAKISADKLMSGGFSDVALKSEYGVRFNGDVDLAVSRSLTLNAKVVEANDGSNVKLTAPNVVIGNDIETKPLRPNNEYQAATPLAGSANLIVKSDLLNLNGQFALSKFDMSTLVTVGEIRMTGVSDPNVSTGGMNQPPIGLLVTAGNLNFSARQIYPTSLSDFTVTANGAQSSVSFNKINPNNAFDHVLSAGGKLTVNAKTIDQNGVLLAPFGVITLNALDTLNLNSGSVTSVSANDTLIPFGYMDRDGKDYLYDFGPNSQQFFTPPERSIKLNASNLNQKENSTVDISGDGDLFAYEWVPGIGGSSDVLAANAKQSAFAISATNTWAIMPVNNQTFASFDTQYWQGSDIKAGDAVYISGVAGLSAGYYTLLPARYALLPGAMLVSSVSGHQDIPSGMSLKLANGSSLVSGHLAAYTDKGYTQTSRTAGFVLRPGADAYKLAQYNTTEASTYFKTQTQTQTQTQAQQPADAGHLSIAATNHLVLKGILNALPGRGGLGAEVDVAAPKLLVVGAGEQTGQFIIDDVTYLAIDELTLGTFKAASLLLGGTRSNGMLEVIASDVRMSENANLAGPEVILAATNNVVLDEGAHIIGSGVGAASKNITIGVIADTNGNGSVDGDGALVRVSGGKAAQVTRLNTDSNRGELILQSGAILEGDGAVFLDASKNISIAGDIKFSDGAALGFSSNQVSLGSPDNSEAVTNGLWLKKAQLDKFVDAGSLFLQSKSTVDLYGDASFGNSKFNLTLESAGIAGYQNTDKTATITARSITLANNENVKFPLASALASNPALGSGDLLLKAETIHNGNNTVRLAGFNKVDISASKELVVLGNVARDSNDVSQNKLAADKNLIISAPRITAVNKADYIIEAGADTDASIGGLLKVQGTIGKQPEFSASVSQGTKLKLSGHKVLLAGATTQADNTIDRHGALIDMQGGQIGMEATGLNATDDNITLESGARILAQGSSYEQNDQKVVLPAGQVSLTSKFGNVDVQLGALVDLTAVSNSDAGKLIVSAVNGEAKLIGEIKAATVGAKGKNGVAIVDAKVIDISRTIAALNTFSGAQSYRVREGDIAIAAADKITAQVVKVMAESGAINVSGIVDASGDKGGSIELYAKNDVTLNAGSELLAKGTADTTSMAGSLGNGGAVILSSDTGIVSAVKPDANGLGGALIDVSGDQVGLVKGEGGEVIFRAQQTITDNTTFNAVNTAGNATILTANITGFTLTSGAVVAFKPNVNGNQSTKLNVNSLGAKSIFKNGGASLASSDLKLGKIYIAVYDGKDFQLVTSVNQANGSDAVGTGVKVDAGSSGTVTGANRVLVEAVKLYDKPGNFTVDTNNQKLFAADANAFASLSSSIAGGFVPTRDGKSTVITPGIEVRSSGDITISSDWNLGNSVTNNSTAAKSILGGGVLTLRANNNLLINGNIDYEDFSIGSTYASLKQKPNSWSYRLIGGSDTSSVNLEAVLGDASVDKNNIIVADGKFIRTGRGFIHAVAGNNIQLGDSDGNGAAIYTEGLHDDSKYMPVGFNYSTVGVTGSFFNPNKELYADGAGDVILNAGRNISGSTTINEVNSWLYHAVLVENMKDGENLAYTKDPNNPQVRWWSIYNNFKNGVASMGGGDVKITVGGDISDMQIVTATNGRMGGDVNAAPDIANFSELGGGDVNVTAGNSVKQVLLHTGNGAINAKSGADMNVALSLMKSKVDLVSTGNLVINSASNPTNNNSQISGNDNKVNFYTYTDETAINAVSLVGDVSIKGDGRVFPSKLFVASPGGDVNIENVILYPSAIGNATLLAGNDVVIKSFIMSEVNPVSLPVITTKNLKTAVSPVLSNYQDASGHTDGLLHMQDDAPVRVYAENDIVFKEQNPLVTPKPVEIKAGHDVVDPNVIAQNIKAADISIISAGNAIRYNEPRRIGDRIFATEAGVQIAGPGRLHLIASGDIDLGTSDGVRSVGNLYNPYLSEQGADILTHAGAAAVPDYNGMLSAYVDTTSQYSSIYLPELTKFMRKLTDDVSLSSSQALADFKGMDRQSQTEFINQVFFAELQTSGRETIKAGSEDYSRSERAILHMFPSFTTNQNLVFQAGSLMQEFGNIANEQVTHSGSLNLFYSQIRSERGGRIEILVPGGEVNAGLAVAGNLQKPDTNLGIVSLRGGELLALVRNDFQVNQSRVFTLGGSNLMLYSALADIDAGKGSKTSSSTPPPVIRIVDGKVTYDYSGAVSGSGIAALTATGGKPGDVDLFAPYGEINAGEAGIRSEGNINIGARVVIGADNIKAGGVTSGVPAASTANVSFSAPVSADASSSAKQSDKATEAASKSANRTANALPSLITVEVLALGEETSTATDPEKDQKTKVKKLQN